MASEKERAALPAALPAASLQIGKRLLSILQLSLQPFLQSSLQPAELSDRLVLQILQVAEFRLHSCTASGFSFV